MIPAIASTWENSYIFANGGRFSRHRHHAFVVLSFASVKGHELFGEINFVEVARRPGTELGGPPP